MTRHAATVGLRLLVDEQRAEAAEWRAYRNTPTPEARTALFTRYCATVRKVARSDWRKIEGMGLDPSDCEQIAYEALLQSIERFDPDRHVPFLAFARPRIRGAIHNALAKANDARASHNARKRAERDRLASLKRANSQAIKDDPIEALRELVVGMALGFMLEDNAQGEAEQVPSEAPSAYDSAVWTQAIQAMETRLANLPEQERIVLEYHYKDGLQFAEIAALLELSRGRISQIHGKALARLRKSLAKFR